MKIKHVPKTTAAKAPISIGAFFPQARHIRISKNGLDEAFSSIAFDAKTPFLGVLDLPAATGDIILPWLRDFRPVLTKNNVAVTLIFPITSDNETTANLFAWSAALHGVIDNWIVALNCRIDPDFPGYFQSPAGTFFRDNVEPLDEIILEKRPSHIEETLKMRKLSHLTAIRQWEEKTPVGLERLGSLANMIAMGRVEVAHRQIQSQLDTVAEALLPVPADDKAGTTFKHRVVMLASGPGGLGKSTIARSLIDWYHDDNLTPVIFDGETETRR